jgi:hypothetical protein
LALQLPEHELFETVDLYEEKDMTVTLDLWSVTGNVACGA